MDACKCIVPLRHGGALNSRQAASPLVRWMEGEERWEAPPGVSPSKLEWNRAKSYCRLRDARSQGVKILALSRDEFRWPRSDFVRQGATTENILFICAFQFLPSFLFHSRVSHVNAALHEGEWSSFSKSVE
ncbi:hypothetical protein TNCV_3941191 [Trichonephila clavipes]|uniref:Uncharacterized protein n=1 Tax=Trichonephila clavipes TaxID=2585209 RepID=A0A8X6VVZ9_TRICX|nr:hypothetical protein TNCV_3941191 [Trichonephila clavipes]